MRSVAAVPGDQPFWGEAVSTARVGPKPISIDRVTTKKLIGALRVMARPEVKRAAVDLGRRMQEEDGAASAVDAFHRHAFIIRLQIRRHVGIALRQCFVLTVTHCALCRNSPAMPRHGLQEHAHICSLPDSVCDGDLHV